MLTIIPAFAARQSAAAAACAPAALPLSRSGSTRRPSSRCHGLSICRCRWRRCRRSAPAMRCRPSSQSRGTSICRCRCARSVDPTALPLRRRGAERRLGAPAHRSVAGTARAPATLPPFRSGTASPTIVPVRGASVLTVVQTPQRVDLPLPLRALRRTYRRCAPAVRRRPSSRSHGASIFRCHCARSGGGTGPVPGTGAGAALAPVPAPVTQPGLYEAHRSEGRRAQMVRVRKWRAHARAPTHAARSALSGAGRRQPAPMQSRALRCERAAGDRPRRRRTRQHASARTPHAPLRARCRCTPTPMCGAGAGTRGRCRGPLPVTIPGPAPGRHPGDDTGAGTGDDTGPGTGPGNANR